MIGKVLVTVGVLVLLAFPATGGSTRTAATCTRDEHAAAQKALDNYLARYKRDRSVYFRTHRSAAQRAAFVRRQKARIRGLRHAAECEVQVPSPPPPAPGAPSGSQLNPYPLGTTARDAHWQLTVTGVNWDAYSTIPPAMNPTPPHRGYQDVIVTLALKWLGTTATSPGPGTGFYWDDALDYELVLHAVNGNAYYLTWVNAYNCGGYPTSFDSLPDMFSGETATGSGCWQVLSTDLPSLELQYSNISTNAESWFALR